ncbi:peptidyl-prolyl cis-trans isomerase [Pukyongiella litopenaei]|uniref:Peptidylprolyl isomerase n=1 Tax=Pukyongiella litopenaei TaxID=2605946 RepID=A0A2S0MTP3_9RHOB|nr:peptidyl-prolyl cis-trans isomerase [Pukyongiella litopenaei]AVO39259.1 peptidylprolyl isomerase [Pukyongiella litopenaei]
MAAGIKSFSKTFVWVLLGLLILGLGGFGATNLTGTVRTVATVGDQSVSVDDYARELQREIRAIEAQSGQPLPMTSVQALGLDQQVLSRLVSLAAIDDETAKLGLSIGDANLQKEIVAIPAFQGIDGTFDREAYRFALQNAGLTESEFEADLRAEQARTLVQGAIVAGVEMPAVLADTMADYVAARRSFTVATLDAAALDAPLPEPTDSDLKARYDDNPDAYMLPETKRLTYAKLTPDMILDQVELEEASLKRLYDERSDEYDLPERRLVERLVFADEDAAKTALAQIELGGSTFEAQVDDRGLSLSDVDLGDITAADLGDAADAVFAAEIGDVVGPLPTSLGPALFRVNGLLEARVTSFEDALPELRDELAVDRARRLIEAQAQDIDDLLAGGATLEELADETEMEVGTLDWTEASDAGIAAYPEFRSVAAQVTDEDFPAITHLGDGGVFALRLDEVLPPRPEPFEDARARVEADWRAEQLRAMLQARAQQVSADIEASGDFQETGLPFRVENGLTRTAYLDGMPPDFMTGVFEMTPGEIRVIDGEGAAYVVRLDSEAAPEDTPELAAMKEALGAQMSQGLSQALFQAFMRDAHTRARPEVDQRALNAVQASFQ